MEYRAENVLFCLRIVLGQFFYELFCVFPFGYFVLRASGGHHGQIKAVDCAHDVAFLDINERSDEFNSAFVHICRGGETGKAPFVKQGEQYGFRHIVGVVPECERAAAQTVDFAVEGAASEFRAE